MYQVLTAKLGLEIQISVLVPLDRSLESWYLGYPGRKYCYSISESTDRRRRKGQLDRSSLQNERKGGCHVVALRLPLLGPIVLSAKLAWNAFLSSLFQNCLLLVLKSLHIYTPNPPHTCSPSNSSNANHMIPIQPLASFNKPITFRNAFRSLKHYQCDL
jgi:hypothetical protein